MIRRIAIVMLLAVPFAFAQEAAKTAPATGPAASVPATKASPKPKATTEPSAADKALVAAYRKACEEVKDIAAAREGLNWDANEFRNWASMLAGEKPAAAWELNRARIMIKEGLAGCETVKKLPPARSYVMRKASGPVVIDGKLDEKAWETASTVEEFWELNVPTPPARQHTKLKMMWDAKYLYVGFICQDANIDLTAVKRDGDTYNYDCIEVFLMPKFPDYWEINITPGGSLYDARMKKRTAGYGGDSNVDASVEGLLFKSTLTGPADAPTGYVTEVAFPVDQLVNFTAPAKVGDTLKMLATRVDSTPTTKPGATATAPAQVVRQNKFYAFTPIVSWFHNVWCYATVKLEE